MLSTYFTGVILFCGKQYVILLDFLHTETGCGKLSYILYYELDNLNNWGVYGGNFMNSTLWQNALSEIEHSVSEVNFKTWFKPTTLLSFDGSTLVVEVSNIFSKRQFEVKFNDLIVETLAKQDIHPKTIQYKVKSAGTSRRSKVSREIAPEQTTTQTSKPVQMMPATKTLGNSLNPKYTFESFIVGSCNDLAHTACYAVASNPGVKYNPLFIYGGVGLGKTHLLQAVGNKIQTTNPSARVLYISSETFVSDFLEHIRFKKTGFSEKYRNVDVLIIDDMQFIAGKEKTQEEFFHTFNTLHQANKQIIIGSDKPPRSIPTLTERLRSRLEWGMAIDIQMPDFETRCAIIETKASLSNVTLERNTVEFLASQVKTNVRELEGALNQVLAFAEMRGVEPSITIAEGLLNDVAKTRPRHITPKQIITKTAHHFQVEVKEVCSARRDKHIALPRQVAMYLLRSELHMSFPKIANELGRKDHTTAMHSVDKIEKSMKIDLIVREHVADIQEQLYA